MKWVIVVMALLIPLDSFAELKCKFIESAGHSEAVCEGDTPPPKIENNQEELDAKANEYKLICAQCEKGISNLLKAPATAQYHFGTYRRDTNFMILNVAVDAQNGYGALIRDHFYCLFDYNNQFVRAGRNEHVL